MPEDKNPKAARAAADGKAPLHLIDTAMTHPAARVLAGGADKYGVRNWRSVPINASTYIGALRRHVDEWADGSDFDKDSGEHPLAHAAATCDVVLDAIKHGTLVDDRAFAEARIAAMPTDGKPCTSITFDEAPAETKDEHVNEWLQRSVNEGEVPDVADSVLLFTPSDYGTTENRAVVDCGNMVLTTEMVAAYPVGTEFRRFADCTATTQDGLQCCYGKMCQVNSFCKSIAGCTGAVKL